MTNVLILGNNIDASNLIDSESNTTLMDINSLNRFDLDNNMMNTNIVVVELDKNSSIDLIPTVVESMKVCQVKKIIVLNKESSSQTGIIHIATEFLKLSKLDYQIVNSSISAK